MAENCNVATGFSLVKAGAVILLVASLLLIPFPGSGREVAAITDLMHAPLFALLAFFGCHHLCSVTLTRPGFGRACLLWALLVGFGGGMELVQGLVGRDPSWLDFLSNALGALIGTIWYQATRARSIAARYLALLASVLILSVAWMAPLGTLIDVVLQRIEMPQVASFENRREMQRWTGFDCRIQRVAEHASHGKNSLLMELHPARYSGAELQRPARDWSQYDLLLFRMYLENGPPLDVIVKIRDAEHNGRNDDRFHRKVRLFPGAQDIRILLADVEAAPHLRKLDLRQITSLQIFTARLKSTRRVYLDNIRLAHQDEIDFLNRQASSPKKSSRIVLPK